MDATVLSKLFARAEERMVSRLDWRGATDYQELRQWADLFVREVAVEDVPEAGKDEIAHVIISITVEAGTHNSDWIGFVRKMRPGLCDLADCVRRGEITESQALASLKDADPDAALFEELMKTSGLS